MRTVISSLNPVPQAFGSGERDRLKSIRNNNRRLRHLRFVDSYRV